MVVKERTQAAPSGIGPEGTAWGDRLPADAWEGAALGSEGGSVGTISITLQIPVKKYRMIQEAARETNQDILTFIKNPELKCCFCPCGDKEKNTCRAGGDGSCLEEFYRFLFMEDASAPDTGLYAEVATDCN
ncbi:MAG: hypothetical protein LBQ30_03045 [Treponema sp.]|jgi:hypothetical protein|nr:hypothetical protein [Treponema sp.]